MKSFKVIIVAILLLLISGVLIVVYVRHNKALVEEAKRIFQAVYTDPEIIRRVGTVKDAAFAYGRQGSSDEVAEMWTRSRVGDFVEGSARLNLRAERAWARAAIFYRYSPATGEFRVIRVELDQIESAPTERN